MKRYFAFYGDTHYPGGGMNDFIGDFDTIEEAIAVIESAHAEEVESEGKTWEESYGEVWDSETRQTVHFLG